MRKSTSLAALCATMTIGAAYAEKIISCVMLIGFLRLGGNTSSPKMQSCLEACNKDGLRCKLARKRFRDAHQPDPGFACPPCSPQGCERSTSKGAMSLIRTFDTC
jgi:hypothetical protein